MRKHTSYNEALEIVALYKKKNTAYSFHNKAVSVVHEDGTTLFFECAYAVRYKDYHIICTEHHGYFAYHIDDATVKQYTSKSILKPSLNKTDTCEGCENDFRISELFYTSTCTGKGCGILVFCKKCKEKEWPS